jgi:predicted Zn-dependent protease
LVVIRDAETETLLRNVATPLFRAAGLEPNLVRIIVIRDDAINSFVSTGNRMFAHTGLIEEVASADGLIGMLARETGHVYGGHLAKRQR